MAVITDTFTATLQNVPMMDNHNGVCYARGKYLNAGYTASGSMLNRIHVCKVPAGAVILNWWGVLAGHATGSGTNPSIVIGIADDGSDKSITASSTMLASDSLSASRFFCAHALDAPIQQYCYDISVSDNAANQYKWVMAVITWTSMTNTCTVQVDLVVQYTMDRQIVNLATVT
jgi:hypothetical protein